jgi:ABC-2 type transport system ATP-binding protein
MQQQIINVQGLSKSFGNFNAVSNLSFTVDQGDIYGFLGQNGAGKSTTIRMLLSLIAPTSGTIEIFGKKLQHHRNEILQKIGAVIERPDLYKYLSAYDNLNIFGKLSGLRLTKQQILEKLAVVGLEQRATSKVKTFSQGMKQRLGIAIAMVHNPDLIILDEPTNGLDPQGIADMRKLIISLGQDLGKTVIISSHLLAEIEMIANRIIIIDKGKTVVQGLTSELLDPAKTIVEVHTNNMEAAVAAIKTTPLSQLLKSASGSLKFELNKADIPQLNKQLIELGIEVSSLSPRHSLEDYFLQLTAN